MECRIRHQRRRSWRGWTPTWQSCRPTTPASRCPSRQGPPFCIIISYFSSLLQVALAASSDSSAMPAVVLQSQAGSALLRCLQLSSVEAVPAGLVMAPLRVHGIACRQRRAPQRKGCGRAPAAPRRRSRPRHPSAASTATAPSQMCRSHLRPSTGAPASPGAESPASSRAMLHSPHLTVRMNAS